MGIITVEIKAKSDKQTDIRNILKLINAKFKDL